MTTKDNEIIAIDGWGSTPGAPEVVRFLQGPQKRAAELARATKIFFEFLRGFRALHFGILDDFVVAGLSPKTVDNYSAKILRN